MTIFPITKVPTTIPGLTCWFDAFDTPTGAVASWSDKSGKKNHATQATGSQQPICTANQLSGKNTLLFTGSSSQTLVLPSTVYSIPNGNNTTFVVAKRSTEDGNLVFPLFLTQMDVSSTHHVAFSAVAGRILYRNNGSSVNLISDGNTNTNYQIITGMHNGSTQSLAVDNRAATTDSSGGDTSATNMAHIGSAQGTAFFLTGGIAEIIIYNKALSASQIIDMKRYLGNKWGIIVP